MGSAALLAMVLVAGGGLPDGRIETEWGWYRVEAESGENPDAEIEIIVSEAEEARPEDLAAPEAQGDADESCPVPTPPATEERAERFFRVDCEVVRGRYLQRILELYGVNAFSLQEDALGAWTHRRPTGGTATAYGSGAASGALTDPALAPLYGEPPVPPGALSFDLQLQGLAKELLACERMQAPAATPSSAAPTPPAPPAAPPGPPPAAPPDEPPPREDRPAPAPGRGGPTL